MKHFYFSLLAILISIFTFSQVGINTSQPNPRSGLHISERTNSENENPDAYNGIIIQRYTTAERQANFNGLTAEDNGLMIYNKDTKCFNYWDGTQLKWSNVCGTPDPGTFTLESCTAPTKVSGNFRSQSTLNTTHTYALSVNVTETGSYTIRINTTNGYYFYKTGIFVNTGIQTVVMDGVGTPINEGTDAVTLVFNGNEITNLTCTLPSINVLPAQTSFAMNCNEAKVYGSYLTKVRLDGNGGSQYIDIPITAVYTPGTVNVITSSANGIYFASGSISISTATSSIRLYGNGVPANIGNTMYQFSDPSNSSICMALVNIDSSRGTFNNPINRCTEILDEDAAAKDGYYWLKGANSKFLTYCDMSNGGWTLVKSLSERQILVIEKTQSESLASQGERNIVSNINQSFNEYAFSLPSYVVSNIGDGFGYREYRFTLKEAGHTTAAGATQTDVASTTIPPISDIWTPDNYWNVTITDGNPSKSNYNTEGYTSEGKLFGYPWGKPQLGNVGSNYFFNEVPFASTPPGMYSQTGFYTGFYGDLGRAGSNIPANNLSYISSDGTTQATFNKYHINDLFGLYMGSEPQLNHHIGTCSNSTDDFGGVSQCAAGWASWRPHHFNRRPDNNYEGRIVQYWVK